MPYNKTSCHCPLKYIFFCSLFTASIPFPIIPLFIALVISFVLYICTVCSTLFMAHGNHIPCAILLHFYFPGWQAPFMAQPAHPQPQDDFPFLLPRTIPAMTAATMSINTALMMIVAIFSIIHVSIEILHLYDSYNISFELLPTLLFRHFQFHACGQLCRLFIWPEQHINHTAENDNGCKQTDDIQVSGKCRTDLINHQCHRIG